MTWRGLAIQMFNVDDSSRGFKSSQQRFHKISLKRDERAFGSSVIIGFVFVQVVSLVERKVGRAQWDVLTANRKLILRP
jgi:hypothetical protein